MTTFQDPPPQSRRAVRQSERGETTPVAPGTPTPEQSSQAGVLQAGPGQAEVAQAHVAQAEVAQYTFDSTIGQTQGAAPLAPPTSAAAVTPPPSGRRQARAAAQDAGAADVATVQPPATPQAAPVQAAPAQASPAGETAEQAAYRVRDFSPEGGRRAAQQAAAPSAASYPPPARPVELDYQTQGVPPITPAAASPDRGTTLEDTLNHTLSRRELREMRAAAEAQNQPAQVSVPSLPEPIDTLLHSGPIDIPTLAPPPGQSQALADAMAEFDLLTRSRREAEARARDAQVASLATPIVHATPPQSFSDQSSPLQDLWQQSAPQAPALIEPASAPQPSGLPSTGFQPSAPQPPVLQQPVFDQQPSVQQPPVEQAPVDQYPPTATLPSSPVAPPQASAPAPTLGSTPQPDDQHGGRSPRASGHWRVQAAMEDDDLPFENTLSRTVGSNTSAITTSALVLPSVPQPGGGIFNSLTATGEILVTGTIDLPKSLGSTGAHPGRVDNSDFEDDPFDSQIAAPDSAPVRAIRAISTNTSTRGVIETKKPQGTRMLTAVIAIASVLCVGLVGLLVFAFASGKL